MTNSSNGSLVDNYLLDRFNNSQLEQAVLCSCIQLEECISIGLENHITGSDFSTDYHCSVWQALTALYNDKQPIDEIVLLEYLASNTTYSEKVLASLIGQILTVVDVPNPASFKTYVCSLKSRSKLRKLSSTLALLTETLNDKTRSVDELISRAEQAIMELSMQSSENEHLRPVCDMVPDILSELSAEQSGVAGGILTGIAGLDTCLRGLKGGQVFVIAARPAIGKTAFALNIAVNVAKNKCPVLFISLEMGANELMKRLMSFVSGVNLRAYRDGYCSRGASEKLELAGAEIAKLPIIIDDYCMQGTSTIASTVRRMIRKYGIRLVIIDYLQLITPRSHNIPREQQIAEISRALKFMAKALNIPVLCLAQLNRCAEIENRTPRLSDLRESGTIEQDADIVAFLDRNEDTRKHDELGMNFVGRDLVVAKNRSGTTTRIHLVFNRNVMRFDRLDKEIEIDK